MQALLSLLRLLSLVQRALTPDIHSLIIPISMNKKTRVAQKKHRKTKIRMKARLKKSLAKAGKK